MKTIKMIDKKSEEFGIKELDSYYKSKIIPPEKKQYLADLKASVGPFMGIKHSEDTNSYMMDAASQIATLGLGFNSAPFFAPVFHEESFSNNPNTEKFNTVRKAFENFLTRKLCWKHLATTFCHSGAEANEIALGYCYRRRVNKNARKVLAFEGSFHGRMQISLSSTWNKAKREPFEWDDFLTEFAPFPNTKKAEQNREIQNSWIKNWESAPLSSFNPEIPPHSGNYSQVEWEMEKTSLLKVKAKLEKGEIFAIIIEPMQCEGGDQYSTNRFFTALTSMAKAYEVPIIFDEVQTGYHLGDDFFWHKQFNLKNSIGENLEPDYLVCAKKAQIGLVVSHCDEKQSEEFSVASFFRGYAHAMSLDNAHSKILNIKEESLNHLDKLINKYSDYIENPRGLGLCFAFDIKDQKVVAQLIAKRFEYGLLYYPAGSHTLRFRLNTGFKKRDIDFLFFQLDALFSEVFLSKKINQATPTRDSSTVLKDNKKTYSWIKYLLNQKGSPLSFDETFKKVKEIIEDHDYDLILIDQKNIAEYIDKIKNLQVEVYEPSRQTEDKVFIDCANHEESVCLALVKNNELHAMSFSGPASLFRDEKGLSDHPNLFDHDCLYTTDTTIRPESSGKRLGRDLKYATIAIGLAKGKRTFLGRNRYQLASSMLDINLSLGAFEVKFSPNDYNDEIKPNDVIHYKIDMNTRSKDLNLSNSINYLGKSEDYLPRDDDGEDKIAGINNKICLSNFVGSSFLSDMNYLLNLAPSGLRHGYTTSGQSECVDKIVKSIWYKNKKGKTIMTFKGHYFGEGSFLSRCASGIGDDFFPRQILPLPNKENIKEIVATLEEYKDKALGIWIEPIGQKTGHKIEEDVLAKILKTAAEINVPVIFNETASSGFSFSPQQFYASSDELKPDAIMTYHGGQLGTVNISEKYFLDKPLMLISTWDGDEFSAGLASSKVKNEKSRHKDLEHLRNKFMLEVHEYLKERKVTQYKIEHGVGYFESPVPLHWSSIIQRYNGRSILNPSLLALEDYYQRIQDKND